MKILRKLRFTVEHKYAFGKGYNAKYYYLSDGAMISDCYDMCNKTNCEFIKIKSPFWNERIIVVKATRQDFIKFVKTFTSENNKYISNIKF